MKKGADTPLIGVTGPDRGGWVAWIFTAAAIRIAGGRPRRLTPSRGEPPAMLDGLVLGGGADVSDPVDADEPVEERRALSVLVGVRRVIDLLLAPLVLLVRLLGTRWSPRAAVDPARDRLERRMLELAERHRLPVLGICRGAQLMNLERGGTLVHDLAQIYEERPRMNTVAPRRLVMVDTRSRLAAALGTSMVRVNSLHRHAVERPGPGLRIVARDSSGVTQAIEDANAPFFVGVQWHPEYLPQERAQRLLFAALVDAARARQGRTAAPRERSRSTPAEGSGDSRAVEDLRA